MLKFKALLSIVLIIGQVISPTGMEVVEYRAEDYTIRVYEDLADAQERYGFVLDDIEKNKEVFGRQKYENINGEQVEVQEFTIEGVEGVFERSGHEDYKHSIAYSWEDMILFEVLYK